MSSFKPRRAIVIGANPNTKNIGHHIAQAMEDSGDFERVARWSRSYPATSQGCDRDLDYKDYDTIVIATGSINIDSLPYDSTPRLESQIEDNLIVPMQIVSSFAHDTEKSPHRRKVVLIGSMAHSKVLTGYSAYSAAKAGLNQFVKSAAFELSNHGDHGVDVFIVNPGNVIDTPMAGSIVDQTAVFKGKPVEEVQEAWRESSGRSVANVGDVWFAIQPLLAPGSSQLSGVAIDMPGGTR